MTTITIHIPDPQLAALTAKAKAEGMSLEDWFRHVAAKEADALSTPPTITGRKEWKKAFNEWIESHDPNTPVLPEEAMRRENIYPDRG